jgi:cardiolipin synthase
MSAYGFTPKWLTIIVISKDVIVLTGSIILYFVTQSLKIEPSFMGKVASAFQFILIGLILLYLNIDDAMRIHTSLFILVAVVTVIAGLHYIYLGLKTANAEIN